MIAFSGTSGHFRHTAAKNSTYDVACCKTADHSISIKLNYQKIESFKIFNTKTILLLIFVAKMSTSGKKGEKKESVSASADRQTALQKENEALRV